MKKIVNKIGGESKLKSLVAALFLVKEYYQNNERSTSLMEERYNKLLEMLENNVYLVEEEILVNKFLKEEVTEVDDKLKNKRDKNPDLYIEEKKEEKQSS